MPVIAANSTTGKRRPWIAALAVTLLVVLPVLLLLNPAGFWLGKQYFLAKVVNHQQLEGTIPLQGFDYYTFIYFELRIGSQLYSPRPGQRVIGYYYHFGWGPYLFSFKRVDMTHAQEGPFIKSPPAAVSQLIKP